MAIHITVTEDTWFIFNENGTYKAGGFVGAGCRIDCPWDLYDKLYTIEQEYIDSCIELGLEP